MLEALHSLDSLQPNTRLETLSNYKYILPYNRKDHRNITAYIALNNLRLILLKEQTQDIYKLK